MSTTLEDLFDLIDLEQAIQSGYVRTQTHPTLGRTVGAADILETLAARRRTNG